MTKTTTALLALLALAAISSTGCTAPTADSYPVTATDTAAVIENAPAEMVGTWQYTTVQGSGSAWTFEADGSATHTVTVTSGPTVCRRTETTVYEGSVQITGRTVEYTATRASETSVDCKGKTTSPGTPYSETLTYEIVSPTELALREVSKCQQPDSASKEAFCRTTFAKK